MYLHFLLTQHFNLKMSRSELGFTWKQPGQGEVDEFIRF